jgi:hypothetical protein
MNRPPNPYRDEHRRLDSEGNNAAGRGDYVESQRLWNEAARLRAKGQAEVEAMSEAFEAGRDLAAHVIAETSDAHDGSAGWLADYDFFFIMGVHAHRKGWGDDKETAKVFMKGVQAAIHATDSVRPSV